MRERDSSSLAAKRRRASLPRRWMEGGHGEWEKGGERKAKDRRRKKGGKKKRKKENTESGTLRQSLWMCTYTRLNTHAHRHVSAPWYVIRDIGESPGPGPVCASPPLSHPRLLHRREPEHPPPPCPSRFFLSFARVPHGTLNLSYATRYHEPRRGTLAIERVLRIPPLYSCDPSSPAMFPRSAAAST